ncbi:MAG: methionyl-tRNA formyltransferase [Acidobacteria bacterium]|nr:methionyl-tRNA formyltransferase [Acidobacteriota bacterium]
MERVAFFGTPEFAVPALDALCESGRRPLLVVSQPARPAGRGRELRDPPVASWAKARGLEVVQPAKTRTRRFRQSIEALDLDLAVVAAYGEILTPQLLTAPRFGFVNVHASLLPRYRGAAPIQAAIAAGDEVTGVTIMQVESGLDSGPILLRREVAIVPDETTAELAPRLARAGAALLLATLDRLEVGDLVPHPQDSRLATYAPRLVRRDGIVDWSRTAGALYDLLRAYRPWPGLTAELEGETIKLLAFQPLASVEGEIRIGRVLGTEADAVIVGCGSGTALRLELVQRPGRGPVSGAEWARSLAGPGPD